MEYYVKSVISIIESNYHKLTSAEKTVADFFIHNNQNTDFSSSHIAELLYTSKATLSRFAKKIGYRGYQEFIYQYENTFEEKEEKITGNTKIVLNAYQEVLNKTYNLVDEAQIGRIVGYLNKADRVLVCGCGSSGLSAKEMEIRFMRIGIDVDSMTDSDMIKMASVFQNRRSLIFGFSISGEREEVTYLLREAYNKGAKTVLFTTNNGKKFSEYYSEVGFKEYSGTNRGQAPYRRSDLLKLHIYGYLNKIRSSRSLEIECKRNLELMWLINAITPDHGTIAGFVKNNRKAFHVTLRNLTLILKGWGLIDGKLIAIDGTKIRAQNSKHNCITKSGLDKKIAYADEQINAYLMALEKDSQCEPEFKKKLEDYQELKKQYHQQKQALSNEGLEQKSLTDPDSRRMKNNGSLDICYNVQSAVDAQNHFVIDISTTNDINDQNQLYIMAKDASDLLETEECTVVADTGYYNASEIKNCLDDGMTVLIKKAKANNSTKDYEFRKDKFKYDPEKDVYICPAEQQLYFFENTSKNGMKYK